MLTILQIQAGITLLGKIRIIHGNLFFPIGNKSCIKTKAFVKACVKNTKLENQEMELVDIYQVKYAAKFAEFSCQESHVMTEKTIP